MAGMRICAYGSHLKLSQQYPFQSNSLQILFLSCIMTLCEILMELPSRRESSLLFNYQSRTQVTGHLQEGHRTTDAEGQTSSFFGGVFYDIRGLVPPFRARENGCCVELYVG